VGGGFDGRRRGPQLHHDVAAGSTLVQHREDTVNLAPRSLETVCDVGPVLICNIHFAPMAKVLNSIPQGVCWQRLKGPRKKLTDEGCDQQDRQHVTGVIPEGVGRHDDSHAR
jgi:hypothetical protein